MRNTKQKGMFCMVSLPSIDKNFKYTVACIDFAIVREGNYLFKLTEDVKAASINYLHTVREDNLSNKLLNKTLPKRYLDAYDRSTHLKKEKVVMKSNISKKVIKSPYVLTDKTTWEKNRVTV